MKLNKLCLANLNGKLSRKEMKSVMGGFVDGQVTITCSSNNSSLACSCSGNCSCSGSNDGSTQCTDGNTGRVICDKICLLPPP